MTHAGLHLERPAGQPAPFDFRSPEQIPNVQIEGIRVVFEHCLRNVSTALAAYVGIPTSMRLVEIAQLSFSTFRQALATPTCLVDLCLLPMPHRAVLEMSPAVVFSLLEILLGAKAGKAMDMQRDLTELEQHVVTGLFRPIVDEFRKALCNAHSGNLEVQGIASHPRMVTVLESDAGAVVFTTEMDIAGNQGLIRLALPAATVRVMTGADRRTAGSQKPSTGPSAAIFDLLRASTIQLEVRLDGETLRLQDLAALKVDDVVSFGRESEQMLECTVNGLIRFKGYLAAKGADRRCFQIEECESGNPEMPSPAGTEIMSGQP